MGVYIGLAHLPWALRYVLTRILSENIGQTEPEFFLDVSESFFVNIPWTVKPDTAVLASHKHLT